jgi:hypothetical protein
VPTLSGVAPAQGLTALQCQDLLQGHATAEAHCNVDILIHGNSSPQCQAFAAWSRRFAQHGTSEAQCNVRILLQGHATCQFQLHPHDIKGHATCQLPSPSSCPLQTTSSSGAARRSHPTAGAPAAGGPAAGARFPSHCGLTAHRHSDAAQGQGQGQGQSQGQSQGQGQGQSKSPVA